MKRIDTAVVITGLLLLLPASGYSQTTTTISGSTDPLIVRREQERRNEADLERRMKIMADMERASLLRSQPPPKAVITEPVIDKETRDRIMLRRRVSPLDAAPYAGLLRSESAGIFKIFPNMSCITVHTIRVDSECSAYVPMTSNFSFRTKGYIDAAYDDIGYSDGIFSNHGFLTQAAIVELGNAPIDSLQETDPRIGVLSKVGESDKTVDDARLTAKRLKAGYQIEGVPVAANIVPAVGSTYAMRVIAYRFGSNVAPPSPNSSMIELRFLSLAADKRDDLTVAFHIVSKDDNGGYTVVWKELRRTEAPKLKLAKHEPLSDFR